MKRIPIRTSPNNYKPTSNLSKASSGSLENIYEKIRDLKSDFQNVEEKMRMAVESLNLPQNNQKNPHETESDRLSSCDSGVSSRYSGGSSNNGYYPGKIAERRERDRGYKSSSSNYSSSSSSGYPPPGIVNNRMEDIDRSFMSSPIYPSSETSSTFMSPTPQPLTHCETYVQIPVDRTKSEGHKVWRMEIARWQMTWQRTGKPTETLGYSATLTEYRF